MTHTVTLRDISPVTHDTYRLVFDKPEGFDITPGQATDMTLDRDGLRDESRPFTPTSQPEDDFLEYVIKSYPDHDGVTKQIPTLKPGETVEISDPWGAIHDAGPGTFIAGGAGITPFISILRRRAKAGTLGASHLIFANKSERDIILREEWDAMEGLRTTYPVDEGEGDHPSNPIDADLLRHYVGDFSGLFYLCGPPKMQDAVKEALKEHGVTEVQIIEEE